MKLLFKLILFVGLTIILPHFIGAQELSQTVRGTVIDQDSRQAVIGANVIIVGSDPLVGTVTDMDGTFRLENVPVGRVSIAITYLGFADRIYPNLEVTSAREVVLQVEMVESVNKLDEVVVRYQQKKTETLDEMALVSSRAFTVDETSRYAGAINDPARMVSSFAGITGNAAGGNEIVVRGNSPRGVQWRLEGVEIPNPNHFTDEGSTGGPINALNSTMLANSDFFTGAFAPEYGNAYSSVFDMNLRNGNNDQFELMFQANTVGLDFTVEGPFKKDYQGSYLFNYRYSSLALLDNLGVVDYGGVPKYQDLSFKLNLPTSGAGNFSLFGLGGTSNILSEIKEKDLDDLVVESYDVQSDLGVIGLNHTYLLNERSYLHTTLSLSENGSMVKGKTRNQEDNFYESLDSDLRKYTARLGTSLHHKINTRNKLQAGLLYTHYFYDFNHREFDYQSEQLETLINSNDNTGLVQAYTSWQHRFNDKLKAVGGFHMQYFTFNNSSSFEPRLSLSYQVNPRHRFFAGFGVHSRLSTITEYLTQGPGNGEGTRVYINKDLELPKARHYVLGHDMQLNDHTHLKTEVYYQDLYDVPIGAETGSTFSSLNEISSFNTERLVNDGLGRNYGIELTLERFLDHGFYYLITASFYDSEYQTNDDIWRDTRFNGRYATNALLGKEYQLKTKGNKQKTLGFNTRLLSYGGLNYTPIDLTASILAGEEIRLDNMPYSARGDNVLRIDLSLTYRINRPKTTQLLKLEIQNINNGDALVEQYYNKYSEKIEDIRQLPMLPVIFYGISF
ncbi:MAG: TonB-dependent receptor [Saprospiraceae bacterium]|nr:TonB-dependent receptor [Lewinella sp.]